MRLKIDLPFLKFEVGQKQTITTPITVDQIIKRGFERIDGSSTAQTAYKIGWFYAGVNKIARNCAHIKWDFYSGDRLDNENPIFKRLIWVNSYQVDRRCKNAA